MSEISEIMMFLHNNTCTGTFTSYKNWVKNIEGHTSLFSIEYTKTQSLKITFMSQDDLNKHVSFLENDKMCFISIIKAIKLNQSLLSEGQEVRLGIMGKYKKFTDNNLVIDIVNFNFTAIAPDVSERK